MEESLENGGSRYHDNEIRSNLVRKMRYRKEDKKVFNKPTRPKTTKGEKGLAGLDSYKFEQQEPGRERLV